MPGADPVRFRWYGTPGDELPDAGDLLVPRGSDPERYLLVHGSAQVRGKQPHDLWLAVTRHRISPEGRLPDEVAWAIDGGARCIYYVPMSRASSG